MKNTDPRLSLLACVAGACFFANGACSPEAPRAQAPVSPKAPASSTARAPDPAGDASAPIAASQADAPACRVVLTWTRDAASEHEERTYDASGRPLTRTLEGKEREAWTYDATGHLLARTWTQGTLTTALRYDYDRSGRVVRQAETRDVVVAAPGSENTPPEVRVPMVRAVEERHVDFHYGQGGLVEVQRFSGGGASGELQQAARLTFQSSRLVALEMDYRAGAVTKATVRHDYTYDASGHVVDVRIDAAEGTACRPSTPVRIHRVFDSAGRMTREETLPFETTCEKRFGDRRDIAYDAGGRISTSLFFTDPASLRGGHPSTLEALKPRWRDNFVYDAQGRLQGAARELEPEVRKLDTLSIRYEGACPVAPPELRPSFTGDRQDAFEGGAIDVTYATVELGRSPRLWGF